jgi:hypothetical protein
MVSGSEPWSACRPRVGPQLRSAACSDNWCADGHTLVTVTSRSQRCSTRGCNFDAAFTTRSEPAYCLVKRIPTLHLPLSDIAEGGKLTPWGRIVACRLSYETVCGPQGNHWTAP